jgi:hypothetical protein
MTHLASRFAAVVLTLLLAWPTAQAQPVVIDFSEFRSPVTTSYQATPGGEVYTKGFTFHASGSLVSTWGTDPGDPLNGSLPTNLGPTAATLFHDNFGGTIDMLAWSNPATDVGGSPFRFSLSSLQVAHLYSSDYLTTPPDGSVPTLSPIGFRVVGWNTPDSFGTASIQSTFVLPPPPTVGGVQTPFLYTLNFSSAWTGLTRVRFFNYSWDPATSTSTAGSAVSWQFTNITAEVVPEPGTYVMVAVGLAGVLLIGRRRRVS